LSKRYGRRSGPRSADFGVGHLAMESERSAAFMTGPRLDVQRAPVCGQDGSAGQLAFPGSRDEFDSGGAAPVRRRQRQVNAMRASLN